MTPSERKLTAEVLSHTRYRTWLRRRMINVELAIALYNMFGSWRKVAEAMPGGFQPKSIFDAVRRVDRS